MKTLRPHTSAEMEEFLTRNDQYFSAGKDAPDEIWTNDVYQVFVYKGSKVPHGMVGMDITWLSIKRNDRNPIHDWRDLQSIKNQVTNREFDAIEIYPRESRLVDEANQFHLWVFTGGEFLPIGFKSRSVLKSTDKMLAGAKQR